MENTELDEQEENETLDPKSENKDQKNELDQTVEDPKKVDDGKQEDSIDPYEKKIAELEAQNRRKSVALSEKNEKIKRLKEQLENPDSLGDQSDLAAQIESLKGEITQIKESAAKDAAEALRIAQEDKIERKIDRLAQGNEGEAKIIKFFFENKTNPNLTLDERIKHAHDLTVAELSRDTAFQEEVKKANQNSVRITGRKKDDSSGWSDDDRALAKTILGEKGLKTFEESGKKRNR